MFNWLRTLIVAGLCFVPVSSLAADRADDLIQRAKDIRRVGDDQGASPLLQEAPQQQPAPQPPPTPPTPPGQLGNAATANGAAQPATATSALDVHAGSSWQRPAKWAAWGLGAVSLSVGFYGVAHNRDLVSQFDKTCAVDPITGPYSRSSLTDAECDNLQSRYQGASRLSLAGFIGAVLFTGVGTVLWMTESTPAAGGEPRSAAACTPELGASNRPSLSCVFRF